MHFLCLVETATEKDKEGEMEKTLSVRERVCINEEKFLSPYAKKSVDSQGRNREENHCDFRLFC